MPLPDGFRVQDQAVPHAPYFEGRGRESDGPEEDSDDDDDDGGDLKEEHEASSSIVVASSSGSVDDDEDNGTVEISGGERPRKRKRGGSSGSGALDGGNDRIDAGDVTVEEQEVGAGYARGWRITHF